MRTENGAGRREALQEIRRHARTFEFTEDAVSPLLEMVGDATLVLVGEATHGTDEFYRVRADLTAALISEKHFNVVAVEADWPDAYRVNRWVRQIAHEAGSDAALGDFIRFPRWMWRNEVVGEFIEWLRDHNQRLARADRVGFYGLDLYSLHASMKAVLEYLGKVDQAAAARARRRYSCFEEFGSDAQGYGYATTLGLSKPCEDEVVAQLTDLRRGMSDYLRRDGLVAEDEFFFAEQNARLVRNAEPYYRSMFGGHVESWNVRDTHMMEVLQALLQWTTRRLGYARAVVWAHNSHLGDARATQMSDWGGLNLGQLARQHHDGKVFSIGFTTHAGTVTAAREWDQPPERRRIRPSLEGSYERLFHDAGLPRFALPTGAVRDTLSATQLERAIGVIYQPETERASHYFRARLADQFDAVVHIDSTTALRPVDKWAVEENDLPEAYPTGV